MTIVVAGGSGFIGTQLSEKLLKLGHTVVIVDIAAPSFTHEALFFINCNIALQPLPYGVLEKADAVINLVGKPINTRWTKKEQEEIRNSRIYSTRHIVETIAASANKPSCFICASAAGFYGDTGEELASEKSPKGEGFLADVVRAWEDEAMKAESLGVRVICVRTGLVLGHGGFLSKIRKTAKLGFLLKLRKKDFWMSWIHEEDIVATYIFALETNTLQGVFNATAPEQVLHSVFMKTLAKKMKKKLLGTLPEFIAKHLFGAFFFEVTKSQRVEPKRLLDKGFSFSHPTLDSALSAILKK